MSYRNTGEAPNRAGRLLLWIVIAVMVLALAAVGCSSHSSLAANFRFRPKADVRQQSPPGLSNGNLRHSLSRRSALGWCHANKSKARVAA